MCLHDPCALCSVKSHQSQNSSSPNPQPQAPQFIITEIIKCAPFLMFTHMIKSFLFHICFSFFFFRPMCGVRQETCWRQSCPAGRTSATMPPTCPRASSPWLRGCARQSPSHQCPPPPPHGTAWYGRRDERTHKHWLCSWIYCSLLFSFFMFIQGIMLPWCLSICRHIGVNSIIQVQYRIETSYLFHRFTL